jgi:uncharacterized protein YjiS (DUF1127 family)
VWSEAAPTSSRSDGAPGNAAVLYYSNSLALELQCGARRTGIMGSIHAVRIWLSRRHAYHDLSSLDDRLLDDVEIPARSRSAVGQAALVALSGSIQRLLPTVVPQKL